MGTYFGIDNLAEGIKEFKYAFAHIATNNTNSERLHVGVVAFNDFAEVEGEIDEEDIEEMKKLWYGESFINENLWTIVRMK